MKFRKLIIPGLILILICIVGVVQFSNSFSGSTSYNSNNNLVNQLAKIGKSEDFDFVVYIPVSGIPLENPTLVASSHSQDILKYVFSGTSKTGLTQFTVIESSTNSPFAQSIDAKPFTKYKNINVYRKVLAPTANLYSFNLGGTNVILEYTSTNPIFPNEIIDNMIKIDEVKS